MSTTTPEDIEIEIDSKIKGGTCSLEDCRKITMDGLWHNNPGLVQLLGLCPLLAVTGNVINGLGLGIATIITLTFSNLIIAFTRNWVRKEIRIPYYVLVIASIVTVIDLSMNAITPELHSILGIFIPLIVTNCVIIGRAEAFASKNNVGSSILDGLGMGLGFAFALTLLGSVREMLGSGALFGFKFIAGDGMLVFILAPGAFIALGYLIALMNRLKKA